MTTRTGKPKAKDSKDEAVNIFMHKVDPVAVQMLLERQRERMDSLELHEAATLGDYDSLEQHLRSGRFDVNMRDPDWQNRTPLHWACARGFVECVRLLLKSGANGTSRMHMGWTPAHCAAEAGKLTVLRALHGAGVAVNKRDKYGDIPCHIAETYGHWECVTFLQGVEAELMEKKRALEQAGDVQDEQGLQDDEYFSDVQDDDDTKS